MRNNDGFYEIKIKCKGWLDDDLCVQDIPRKEDIIKLQNNIYFEVISIEIDVSKHHQDKSYGVTIFCEDVTRDLD